MQDGDEPGIAGATLVLAPQLPSALATRQWQTTSDIHGYYLISQVPPGAYELSIFLPPGFVSTAPNRIVVDVQAGAVSSTSVPAIAGDDVLFHPLLTGGSP